MKKIIVKKYIYIYNSEVEGEINFEKILKLRIINQILRLSKGMMLKMKIENNKGITLIALTITIIVLLIIAGISVHSGSKLIQEAKFEDVKTNMMLVQAEVKNYIEQAKFEKKSRENVITEGITLNGIEFKLESVSENENGSKYCKIINPTMNELNLSKLSADDYLLVIKNETKTDETKPDVIDINFDVYFTPGIINDKADKPYHLLSEMK